MKTTLALATLLLAASFAPAAMINGDVIKLDFGDAADGQSTLVNWNTVTNATGATGIIAPINSNGSAVAGTALTFVNFNATDRFNDDARCAGWGGDGTDPYYSEGLREIYYHGAGNAPGVLSVILSGLDQALTYNVRIYTLIDLSPTVITETLSVTDGASTQTQTLTRGERWNSTSATLFTGVSANSNGELVIMPDTSATIGNTCLNAIVVEAVPEPATMSLLALGGIAMLKRRKK